jgi:hypothetical protein
MDKTEALKMLGNVKTKRLLHLLGYLKELENDGLLDDRTGHLTLQFLKDLGQVTKELSI